MRRSARHALPAVGAVVAMGAMGAVAVAVAAHLTPPSRTPVAASVVTRQAQSVYESFAGTRAQQDAAFVLQAHALNGAMDACMAEHGHPEWDWSRGRGYAAPYDALRPTEWFADLDGRPVSQNEIARRRIPIADRQMNDLSAQSADYRAAVDACVASTKAPSDAADAADAADSAVQATAFPRGSQELVEAWRTTMRTAGVDLGGDPAEYHRCRDAGARPLLDADGDGDTAGEGGEDVGVLLAQRAAAAGPAPAADADPTTYSARWAAFLDLEARVMAVDAECRRQVYEDRIGDLAPIIAAFASDHATDIARVRAGWGDVADRAAALGYRGQTGPLGR